MSRVVLWTVVLGSLAMIVYALMRMVFAAPPAPVHGEPWAAGAAILETEGER